VTSGLGAGGAERVIALLARHLCQRGHTVSVITFDDSADPVYHPLPTEVSLTRLAIPARGGPLAMLHRVRALRRQLRAERPDVVMAFLTKINLLAALATLRMSARLICCERNNPERQQAHPLWNGLLRAAYHRADAIVCQTEAVKRCIPARFASRLVVIPNPITSFHDIAEPTLPKRISAVGRLTYQKGFDLLIDAFASVARHHPEWHLAIWGDGPDQAQLQRRIDLYGLRDRVQLRGNSTRPGSWIGHTDLFALSSRYEGFPNVLGEAMAAGLPIVATRCDFGPEEMLLDGESGLLVANESTTELATSLDRLMSDADLRARLGNAAEQAADRYAPRNVMKLWDDLIGNLLSPARKQSNWAARPATRLNASAAK
jgi:glycosyltransferase involved in cell wall biosynthesis